MSIARRNKFTQTGPQNILNKLTLTYIKIIHLQILSLLHNVMSAQEHFSNCTYIILLLIYIYIFIITVGMCVCI